MLSIWLTSKQLIHRNIWVLPLLQNCTLASGQILLEQNNRTIYLCEVETIIRKTTKLLASYYDDVDYEDMKEVVEGIQGYPRHPR